MNDIVYFELNNWFSGRDYPNAEPFLSWLKNDLNLAFENEEWVKENQLCVLADVIDMSINFCISAKKEWVEKNCPELLTKYTDFLRYQDEDHVVYGRFGHVFLTYKEENIGVFWEDEMEDIVHERFKNEVRNWLLSHHCWLSEEKIDKVAKNARDLFVNEDYSLEESAVHDVLKKENPIFNFDIRFSFKNGKLTINYMDGSDIEEHEIEDRDDLEMLINDAIECVSTRESYELDIDSVDEQKKTEDSNNKEDIPWMYETGHEEPEIMGSGSKKSNIFHTKDEKSALKEASSNNRNYLIRYKKRNGRKEVIQWYDFDEKEWVDN